MQSKNAHVLVYVSAVIMQSKNAHVRVYVSASLALPKWDKRLAGHQKQ
jgi:hypothetical protein